MSEKDTTASSIPSDSGDAQVEATGEALESRGQLGRDYLWNTAASLMSSLAVVIMGVAIVRSGATDSFARAQYGLFTLALAIGQQYQTVGLYEVRTFHVTDVRRRFDFGTYLSTRLLTCHGRPHRLPLVDRLDEGALPRFYGDRRDGAPADLRRLRRRVLLRVPALGPP